MTTVTHAMVWTADNVSSFRGYDINSAGEVELSDGEYADMLTDIYGDAEVCGQRFPSGSLLQDADPVAFRCGKSEEESRLTTDFEEALENEDASEIEFSAYEPDDIDDEDTEEEDDE